MVGTGRGAEMGVIFPQGEALQLPKTLRWWPDKTGTLTEGRPVLTDISTWPAASSAVRCWRKSRGESRSEYPIARAIVVSAEE
ncbi:hypothetical protein KCP76_15460 [Salmonella enterica subsp. enterica serovar Weltevreden]|nr:hypothetical protein KCP76_15460 [Salmonella enterica subsp. enterica serovar Weltevreden]